MPPRMYNRSGADDHSSNTHQQIWLVFHHKEPLFQGAFSYIRQLQYGPTYIDKVCVGAYTSEDAAEDAAREYFESLGLEIGDDDDAGGGPGAQLGGYFADSINFGDANDLSERVYVVGQELDPPEPDRTDVDESILSHNGSWNH